MDWNKIGHYECILQLSDGINKNSYKFLVDVLNYPPVFVNDQGPNDLNVNLNKYYEVDMPPIIDFEGNRVYVTQKLPSFVKYKDG